jgi:hypothetical protein
MSTPDLQTKLKEAKEQFNNVMLLGGGKILNQIFRLTAQQLDGPDNCRRRHCRTTLLCYAKNPVGRDCSADLPLDFFEAMAENMAVLLAFESFVKSDPLEFPRQELLYLIAYVAKNDVATSSHKTELRRSAKHTK